MDFFNYLAENFEDLGNTIINSLPTSPIYWLQANSTIKEYLSYVNWFIPIYSMIGTLEAWLMCIIVYYVMQVILRWAKIIE